MWRDGMPRADEIRLKVSAGTMRPIVRFLGDGRSPFSRFLWRLFDVEYTR
jgi:hypothetical protein